MVQDAGCCYGVGAIEKGKARLVFFVCESWLRGRSFGQFWCFGLGFLGLGSGVQGLC